MFYQGYRTTEMPAIIPEHHLNEQYLNGLKRKDLMNLCKEHGIKAIGKNSDLIEKLLEHSRPQPSTPFNTSEHTINNDIIAPMTPKKKLDACLPIVNTPTSTAVIRSIVQSARKTGLHSSPIRVPFALSPMAKSLANINNTSRENGLPFSPIKFTAKDPSQPIKDAFLSFDPEEEENESHHSEQVLCLPFDNKRPHESDTERNIFDESADLIDSDDLLLHQDKKEKLEFERDEEEEEVMNHSEIIINESESNCSSSSDSFIHSSSTTSLAHMMPPSSFSTDLFNNSKDPELKSPELLSAIDTTRSRSETHDHRTGSVSTENFLKKSHSSSSSTSASSATTPHPLLPSGIIKLLEKKRLEKEHHQHQNLPSIVESSSSASTTTSKKKFDLKESLKRPLSYKPHLGSNFPPKRE